MVYTPKEWGSYEWDPTKSLEQNTAGAEALNALIKSEDLQKIENALAVPSELQFRIKIPEVWDDGLQENEFLETIEALPPGTMVRIDCLEDTVSGYAIRIDHEFFHLMPISSTWDLVFDSSLTDPDFVCAAVSLLESVLGPFEFTIRITRGELWAVEEQWLLESPNHKITSIHNSGYETSILDAETDRFSGPPGVVNFAHGKVQIKFRVSALDHHSPDPEAFELSEIVRSDGNWPIRDAVVAIHGDFYSHNHLKYGVLKGGTFNSKDLSVIMRGDGKILATIENTLGFMVSMGFILEYDQL